jgi:hypothetical protein
VVRRALLVVIGAVVLFGVIFLRTAARSYGIAAQAIEDRMAGDAADTGMLPSVTPASGAPLNCSRMSGRFLTGV